MSADFFRFIASAPRGFADLLARELTSFGASDVREAFDRCVVQRLARRWPIARASSSRLANRVFLGIAEFEAGTADEFYAWAKRVDWAEHIAPGATIACDFTGKHPAITHTHFGALKLKDAIVDALRDTAGFRPDVSLEQPSVRIHAACQSVEDLDLDRSVGREPASAGLSRGGRRSAAQGKRRRGCADSCGLAGDGGGWRGVSRSDVWLGDVCHRSGIDCCWHRAGTRDGITSGFRGGVGMTPLCGNDWSLKLARRCVRLTI